MRRTTAALAAVCFLSAAIGCTDQAPAKVDDVSSTGPSGVWVGSQNGVDLEIQEGGFIRISRNGQESTGSWKRNGKAAITTVLNGQSYNMPYTRKDLELSIVLPGDSSPSRFTQM